jgi:hypothetical protein
LINLLFHQIATTLTFHCIYYVNYLPLQQLSIASTCYITDLPIHQLAVISSTT